MGRKKFELRIGVMGLIRALSGKGGEKGARAKGEAD